MQGNEGSGACKGELVYTGNDIRDSRTKHKTISHKTHKPKPSDEKKVNKTYNALDRHSNSYINLTCTINSYT